MTTTLPPNVTADGRISYDMIIHNRSGREWVEIIHKNNCQQFGWSYTLLRPGAFGFDNIVYSVYILFRVMSEWTDIVDADAKVDAMSAHIHAGWTLNYIYWRDMKPFERDKAYIAPFNALGDPRRDECCLLDFHELLPEERLKDRIIARCVLEHVGVE